MRSLYLSYDGMTDPLGQSQVLPYLTGLSAKGHKITLISFEKNERFEAGKAQIEVICQNASIRWIPLPYTKKPPVLSTIYDILKLIRTVKKLHRKERFNLIHCRSYITAFAGLYMKRSVHLPFLFDMRGFFPEERVDGGLWPQNRFIFRLIFKYFKTKEKYFLQESDHIISLTHKGKEVLLQRDELKNYSHKISVIPCCTDLTHFDPERVSETQVSNFRKKLDIPENALVANYIGSLGTWYLVDDMVRWVAVLHRKYPDFIWLLITRDAPDALFGLLKKYEIPENAIRIYAAGRNDLPALIKLCNFSFFFIKSSFSKQASSPTKQGEIMAMGLPVICNAGVGDSDRIVEKYGSGLVIPDLNQETLEKFAEQIPELLQIDSDKIRKGAEEYFALESGVETYNRIYTKIGKKR